MKKLSEKGKVAAEELPFKQRLFYQQRFTGTSVLFHNPSTWLISFIEVGSLGTNMGMFTSLAVDYHSDVGFGFHNSQVKIPTVKTQG